MNHEFIQQSELEINIFEIINGLIESIAIYKGMATVIDKYKDDNIFITLFNNNAMMIVIRFSNIFGTDSEDNHWKNLFKGYEDDFRKKVIYTIFKNEKEFKSYHNNLTSFRSKYSVHYKVGKDKYYIGASTNSISLPNLDVTLELTIKTLIYMLEHFKYENRQNAYKDINEFYNKQLQKTIQKYS